MQQLVRWWYRASLMAVLVGSLMVSHALANAAPALRTPEQIIAADGKLMPNLRPIYSAKTKEKEIALTFDISWGQQMAPKVLDVLKAQNIKATFFLSGPWARDHVDLVNRIVADGHEVQSHGHRHDNLDKLGREGTQENIQAAHTILKGLIGKEPTYIRPPNGAFDNTSVQATKDLGYATVMWSVDSLDWKNPGVDTIVRRSTTLIHPGAIVLMHASDSCKQTDQALPTVIETLRQQGYKFVGLDQLIRTHGIDMNGFIHVRPNQKS